MIAFHQLRALTLVLVAVAPVRVSATPTAEDTTRIPSTIEGTLRLNGCAVAPSAIRLIAEPLRLGASDFRREREDPPGRLLEAKFDRTADPHSFRFSIDEAEPLALYRLRVAVPPNPCGRVFWRGPVAGLASAGQSDLLIEGFAARTTVEVAELGSTSWVGADDLRFEDPSKAVRTFRWRSTLQGVVEGELQVSIEPFPLDGAFGPCDEPRRGMLLRRRTLADPRGTTTRVDFRTLLLPRRDGSRSTEVPDRTETGLDEATYVRLLASKPVYVRVVPITADGPACDVEEDGVHGWVMLAKLPNGDKFPFPQVPDTVVGWYDQHYTPPYLGGEKFGHPNYRELAFKVIKAHYLSTQCAIEKVRLNDPMGCFVVTSGARPAGSVMPVEDWFYFTPYYGGGGGGGFLDGLVSSFSNLTTATLGAAGLGVEFFHDLYEDIKKAVSAVIVDVFSVFPYLQEACDKLGGGIGQGDCQDLVQAGIETGLASMGIPPSLPSWDKLKDEGIDYVASLIATEIESKTGFPTDLTEPQLKAVAKNAIDQMGEHRAGAGLKSEWLLPYAGFEPAVWSLTIKKDSSVTVPPGVQIVTKHYGLYEGATAVLPTQFPSNDILRIPLVLRPSLEGIKPPYCYTDWTGNVKCGPYLPGKQSKCVWQLNSIDGFVYETYPCSERTEAIYYRNAWIWSKFVPTKCAILHASAVRSGPDLSLPWPFNKGFHDLAILSRAVPATWDGWAYFHCP